MPPRVAHEFELPLDLGLHPLALGRAETVPLVDPDDERPSPLDREADQVQVLIRHALARVEHDDHDLGLLDRLEALHDAELLDRVADARPATNAGGIDQREPAAVAFAWHDDAVARRAGLVRRHETLVADQPIDQGRLADVRSADDGDLGALDLGDLVGLARLERREHGFDQRIDALAVQRRDRERRAETEPEEVRARERRFHALRLVHGHRDPLAGAAQALGDPLVLGRDAVAMIDDEDHDVGLLERRVDLLLDERLEAAAGAEAARVDHEVGTVTEACVAVAAIAGDAGVVRDERIAGARQAIEQRRLTDVRPADQRDGREHRSAPQPRSSSGSSSTTLNAATRPSSACTTRLRPTMIGAVGIRADDARARATKRPSSTSMKWRYPSKSPTTIVFMNRTGAVRSRSRSASCV